MLRRLTSLKKTTKASVIFRADFFITSSLFLEANFFVTAAGTLKAEADSISIRVEEPRCQGFISIIREKDGSSLRDVLGTKKGFLSFPQIHVTVRREVDSHPNRPMRAPLRLEPYS